MKKYKIVLTLLGIAILLANTIVLYITFLVAYFFNDMQFSFCINKYGEANFELMLLSISLFLGLFVFVNTLDLLAERLNKIYPAGLFNGAR